MGICFTTLLAADQIKERTPASPTHIGFNFNLTSSLLQLNNRCYCFSPYHGPLPSDGTAVARRPPFPHSLLRSSPTPSGRRRPEAGRGRGKEPLEYSI